MGWCIEWMPAYEAIRSFWAHWAKKLAEDLKAHP